MNSSIRDLPRQKFKRKPNSDGLIKCLPQPGQICNNPKVYARKFAPSISFTAPRQFRLPGQSLRGLRATALAPCFLLCHLDNFIVTRNLLPSPGTGKKHVTATQTAPNQTAGPLEGMRKERRWINFWNGGNLISDRDNVLGSKSGSITGPMEAERILLRSNEDRENLRIGFN
jgi:hypothetical protein